MMSRVLGLVRESVQAAAFGTTALADVVVTLMTLPDLASSVLAGGALSYALLPWWARQVPHELARSQRRAAIVFLCVGAVLALWIALVPALWAHWLAPGVGTGLQDALDAALRWSALAVPLSLLSFVWYTRLQHERDVVGMYGMNVVHTAVVIAALLVVGHSQRGDALNTVGWLGVGLLLAFGLRSVFLQWRLRRSAAGASGRPSASSDVARTANRRAAASRNCGAAVGSSVTDRNRATRPGTDSARGGRPTTCLATPVSPANSARNREGCGPSSKGDLTAVTTRRLRARVQAT